VFSQNSLLLFLGQIKTSKANIKSGVFFVRSLISTLKVENSSKGFNRLSEKRMKANKEDIKKDDNELRFDEK